MGDDSPRAHALKHSDSHRSHKSRDSFATSELWALSRGPKTTSINPGHHIFPTLLVPADYSDPWRACATVYHTFTIPDCVAGKVIFALVNASIILAFVVFCLESESGRRAPTATAPAAFWSIDVLCTALFVFDYAARLFTCVAAPWAAERLPGSGDAAEGGTHCCARGGTSRSVARNLIHFLFAPLNMIDAVATFPTVAALAMGQTDAVRRLLALRVLRLVHVARVVDFHEDSAVVMLTHALFKSADVLAAIFFAFAVVGAFLSTTVFFCEAGSWSDTLAAFARPGELVPSPFASVPLSMWWTVGTATAVGYGDIVPTTPCGKAVGTVTILIGVIFLALPTAVLVNAFGKEYDARVARQLARDAAAFARRVGGDESAPHPSLSATHAASISAYPLPPVDAGGPGHSVPPHGPALLFRPSSKAADRVPAQQQLQPQQSSRYSVGSSSHGPSRRLSISSVHPLPLQQQPLPSAGGATRRSYGGAGPSPPAGHGGSGGGGSDVDLRALIATLLNESHEMRLALQSVTEQLATLRGGSDHTGTATGRHNNRRASATTSSSAAPALTAPPPGTMLTEHTMVAEEEDLPTEVVLVRDATGRDRTEADNAAAAGTGVIRVDSHRIDRP